MRLASNTKTARPIGRKGTVLAALAAAVVAVPAGLAVADGGDEISPNAAAETDCPEAAKFTQSIGFGPVTTYGATCPSVDQLKEQLTDPGPHVPSVDQLPGARKWIEENDIPVIEVGD